MKEMAGNLIDRVPVLNRILSNNGDGDVDPEEYQVPELSLLLLLAGGAGWVGAALLLAGSVPYHHENFQWTLGAELQAVAAVFALAITGTLIAAQIAQSTTPRIVPFLAPRTFLMVVAFVVVTLAADVVTLMLLPEENPTYWSLLAICLVVAANIAAVVLVVAYARLIMARMQPEAYLAALRDQVRAGLRHNDLSIQASAIHALEELGQYSSGRRHVQTCIDVCEYLEKIGLEQVEALDENGQAQHEQTLGSIELIPDVFGRLGAAYAEAGMDDAVYPITDHMASLAGALCRKKASRLPTNFAMAMENILFACGSHDREWVAYNLVARKTDLIPLLAEQGAEDVISDWLYDMEEEMKFSMRWNFVNSFDQICRSVAAVVDLLADGKLSDRSSWKIRLRDRVEAMSAQLDESSMGSMTPRFDERTAHKIMEDLKAKFEAVSATPEPQS